MKSKSAAKGIIYFILFIILIGLDQLTKYLATIHLKDKDPFVIIKDVFEFNYLDGGNTGAAWGILSGKISFFIVLTIFVCILLVFFIVKIQNVIVADQSIAKKLTILQITFVCLLAGAVGNLIDRAVNGYVVDFIYFKLINFPIFNVADCYVTVSSILLIIICLFFINDDEFTKIFSFKKLKDGEEMFWCKGCSYE